MQKQEEDVKPEDEGFNGDVDSKFKDEDLSCVDCSNTFVFTIGEQEFFEQKGFTNKPTRCKDCKQAKRDRMNGGGNDRGGRGGGGRGGGGAPVCYANQRGECTRGADCRFSHDGGGGGGGGGGRGGFGGGRGGFGGDRGGGGGGGGVCYA